MLKLGISKNRLFFTMISVKLKIATNIKGVFI